MLIINSKIISWDTPNQILEGYALWVNNELIGEIGEQQFLTKKHAGDEVLDAKGQLLFPGLICAHTHFYGVFSRGMNIHGASPADFPEILKKLWWPLDQSLTAEDIYYSAMVCLVDAIKHGTTTLFDHHASPNHITNSLDMIEKAFTDSGVRGVACYEVTDRGGEMKAQLGIRENLRMLEKLQKCKPSSLVRATFGMHAGLTLSDKTLDECRKVIPDGDGIHIHVAEHPVDQYDSLQKSGKRVVHRLHDYGFLGDRSILVHGVHLDHHEVDLIRDSKTWLTHQPRSNMNNAVGLGDIESILDSGVNVCLGNDGFSNAMWDEWRTCYLVHKAWHRDPRRMGGDKIIRMAVNNNSDLATTYFEGVRVGKIEPGAKADLILVDYNPVTMMTADNLPWHILFGFRESMVTTTMINGKVLMKDRVLLNLDEKEISSKALELSKNVWQRYEKQFS